MSATDQTQVFTDNMIKLVDSAQQNILVEFCETNYLPIEINLSEPSGHN